MRLSLRKSRRKNSRTITVEDRAAQNGDTATIDFEGFVDGEAFEGGKGTDYPLTLGSNTFIPGFEEQLVGANTGDHVEVKVTFPEEYQAKELAGKEAVFQCDVKKIEQKSFRSLTMTSLRMYLSLIHLLSTRKTLRRT